MAWSRVQGAILTNTGFSGATTIVKAFGAAVTSGNMVRGSLTFDATNTNVISSIADDKGNGYLVIDQQTDAVHGQVTASFWSNGPLSNAPATVTVTLAASSSFRGMEIEEWSGGGTGVALDGHTAQVQQSPGTSTDAVTSGSFTTTANGDLVVGTTYSTGGSPPSSISAGTGFTSGNNDAADSNCPSVAEFQTQSSAGSIAATFTIGTASTMSTLVAAFKSGGGASVKKLPPFNLKAA